jgi:hypothetical protein
MIDAGSSNLIAKVRKVLSESPIWELRQLQVEQKGETVYLHGRVCSFYHKQLAQEVILRATRELPLVNEISVDN